MRDTPHWLLVTLRISYRIDVLVWLAVPSW